MSITYFLSSLDIHNLVHLSGEEIIGLINISTHHSLLIQIDRLTSLGIKSHFAANHIEGTFEKKEDGATNSKKTMPTNPARPPTLYFIRCSESTRPLPGRLCKYIAGATPHSTIFAASKLKKECGLSTFNECRQTTHSYSIQQCLSPNHSNTV